MKIAQYKQSKIADAPDELSKAINKYSEHSSIIIDRSKSMPKVDIIHNHNKKFKGRFRAKQLIQFHSEPSMVDLYTRLPSLVIAQYHATLKEFKNATIVRNIIDFNQPLYKFNEVNKIRIGFSPSRMKPFGKWHNKGYDETIKVLNEIKREIPSVEIDIITNVSLDECIRRKSMCSIIIDECVTSSYHRSGLEGLALGKLTICSLDNEVETIFKNASGALTSPFTNVWIDDLKNELIKIIEFAGLDFIKDIGHKNFEWMREYWDPKTIVNEFIKIYENL